MTNRIIATGLAIIAAAALAACSGPASAASAPSPAPPTSTAASVATTSPTTTSASPSKTGTPTVSAAGVSADPSQAAFEQSSKLVASLVAGDRQAAATYMTPLASAVMQNSDLKDYLFHGRNTTSCQAGKDELKLQNPAPVGHISAFTTESKMVQAGARVSGVKVVCDGASFGLVVSTVGPSHDVDGIESHAFPDARYFAN